MSNNKWKENKENRNKRSRVLRKLGEVYNQQDSLIFFTNLKEVTIFNPYLQALIIRFQTKTNKNMDFNPNRFLKSKVQL